MILSVIVPDDRPGMQRMLRKEADILNPLTIEIIYDDWRSGLEKAQGDFVCLLEYDSAISPGSLARQVEIFMDNPSFRKLAMVCPLIEFDDAVPMEMRYIDSTVHFNVPTATNCMLSRVGIVAGAVIRRTSLKQREGMIGEDLVTTSAAISLDMWDKGLRIMQHNSALYYSPESLFETPQLEMPVSESVTLLWGRELIS